VRVTSQNHLKALFRQIEKLHGLEALPPHGFHIACFPVKVRAASAGWTRAVAILDE
jgi:kynurenine formamidase